MFLRNSLQSKITKVAGSMYHHLAGVSPSNLAKVYRADRVIHAKSIKLQLLELLYFRFSKIQHPITARDITKHQGSTQLVGTTADKKVAYQLAKRRNPQSTVLTIDSSIVNGILIDVTDTVERHGTSFFTKIPEIEHALPVLPIYSVQSFELLRPEQTEVIINPFYASPSNHSIEYLKMILKQQMTVIEKLCCDGDKMTPIEIQILINSVIDLLDTLFQENMGNNNPFRMTVAQYQEHYGTDLTREQLKNSLSSALLLDVLTKQAHEFFMDSLRYKELLGSGDPDLKRMIEKGNQEAGYDDIRRSYAFE